MSGIKPIAVTEFIRTLKGRGMTLSELANQMNCGRSHLSQVINGHRPGGHTWAKLAKALPAEDVAKLREGLKPVFHNLPRGTNIHMEQGQGGHAA